MKSTTIRADYGTLTLSWTAGDPCVTVLATGPDTDGPREHLTVDAATLVADLESLENLPVEDLSVFTRTVANTHGADDDAYALSMLNTYSEDVVMWVGPANPHTQTHPAGVTVILDGAQFETLQVTAIEIDHAHQAYERIVDALTTTRS